MSGAPSLVHNRRVATATDRRLALELAIGELEEMDAELTDRHDITSNDQPNMEMRMSTQIERIVATLRRVQESEASNG